MTENTEKPKSPRRAPGGRRRRLVAAGSAAAAAAANGGKPIIVRRARRVKKDNDNDDATTQSRGRATSPKSGRRSTSHSPKRRSASKHRRSSRKDASPKQRRSSSARPSIRKGRAPPVLAGGTLQLQLHQAADLMAKERKLLGRRTSSDPYAVVYLRHPPPNDDDVDEAASSWIAQGQTKVISKTLHPKFDHTLDLTCGSDHMTYLMKQQESITDDAVLEVCLYDHDNHNSDNDDFMGAAILPIWPSSELPGWFSLESHSVATGEDCTTQALGQIQVTVQTKAWWLPELQRGHVYPLPTNSIVRLELHYQAPDMVVPDTTTTTNEPDHELEVDVSCVALDGYGAIAWDQCLYFSQTSTPALSYAAVEEEDPEDDHDNEDDNADTIKVNVDLAHMPSHIVSVYYVVHVLHPLEQTTADLSELQVRIGNPETGVAWVRFVCPKSPATCQVVLRLARVDEHSNWVLVPVAKAYPNSRDFGTLIPQLKSLTKDLVPGIPIQPDERIALFRPGSTMRILDYTNGDILADVLEWSVQWQQDSSHHNHSSTATAYLLDSQYQVQGVVSREKPVNSSSVKHVIHKPSKGNVQGESFLLGLYKVPARVQYICITLSSMSNLEGIACQLKDPAQNHVMGRWNWPHGPVQDSSMLLAYLLRDGDLWNVRVVAQPTPGQEALDEWQSYLSTTQAPPPPVPFEPETVKSSMPEAVPYEEEEKSPLTEENLSKLHS